MNAAAQTTADRALLHAYLDAVYRIDQGDGSVDLTIGSVYPHPPKGNGMHAVLTACNPGSNPLPEVHNVARMSLLKSRIERWAIAWRPAIGESADGHWREPSFWLTDIELMALDALAIEFGQNACVVVDHNARVCLRVYRADWRTLAASDSRLQWADTGAAA